MKNFQETSLLLKYLPCYGQSLIIFWSLSFYIRFTPVHNTIYCSYIIVLVLNLTLYVINLYKLYIVRLQTRLQTSLQPNIQKWVQFKGFFAIYGLHLILFWPPPKINNVIFLWGGGKEKVMGLVYGLKKHKMALISEYLAADLSADASADALAIINIG